LWQVGVIGALVGEELLAASAKLPTKVLSTPAIPCKVKLRSNLLGGVAGATRP
jgi:hypothetical protein